MFVFYLSYNIAEVERKREGGKVSAGVIYLLVIMPAHQSGSSK